MRRRAILGATLAMPAILRSGLALAAEPVDVELILAVDVSRSVDPQEQEMQFGGYEAAFRDRRLIEGIMDGPVGAIACTMFTWSGFDIQNIVVPWTRLDSPETANRFADAIAAAPRRTWLYTSISGAIDFAAGQFGRGFEGTRRVVDISGDGPNNSGRPVAEAREEALAQGIVLNGLAVLDRTPQPVALTLGEPPLDEYYQEEVIGGPGSFLVVAEGFTAFAGAVRRKIIREIAAAPPPGPRGGTLRLTPGAPPRKLGGMPDSAWPPGNDAITAEILRQTTACGAGKSICPSEVARTLAGGGEEGPWRLLMGPVRQAALALQKEGRIEILRKGKPVPPEQVRGVIRLRAAPPPAEA